MPMAPMRDEPIQALEKPLKAASEAKKEQPRLGFSSEHEIQAFLDGCAVGIDYFDA